MLISNARVVVQWEGHEVFNRVGLQVRSKSVKVLFGYVFEGQFVCGAMAVFPYSQHPEIKNLHDGCSFDLDAIKRFLSTLMLLELAEGLTHLRFVD